MLWLAVHLPFLPLEVYARAAQTGTPLAVSRRGRVEEILLCNRRAWKAGVRPGMPIGGARALAADLTVVPRQEPAERDALERLAAWCVRFSPDVSLEPPQSLVLEVGLSLRLFRGAEALLAQVAGGVAGLGYRARCCIAPTPGGALRLAACRREGVIPDLDGLRTELSLLPLASLGLDERMYGDLWNMGLRRVGDLLRLPRTGLSERLGPEAVLGLRRLLGEVPDPRRMYTPPARYRGSLELPAELLHSDALIFPCRRLLDELAGLLEGMEAGVQRLSWTLKHPEEMAESTRFDLGTTRPERDTGHWLGLLRERLARLSLPAPVRALGLEAGEIHQLSPVTLALFPGLDAVSAPDASLLDRLRARLGRDAVRGLAVVADHRPERAWRWCPPGESFPGLQKPKEGLLRQPSKGRRDRPLWLLPEPLQLDTRGARPWWDGELDLGFERERIETGWWDGSPVARDYFVATSVRGERLWVYREIRGERRWFLHGFF
jgi:protein ImuB